jgi:hypothetical protein
MLGVDVESLSLAGAFLLGAILATVAVLRLVRTVVELVIGLAERDRRQKHDREHDRDAKPPDTR